MYFYHLTQSALDVALYTLLEKSLGQGWRVGLRAMRDDTLERLDTQLWILRDDGFLPHGVAGGAYDGDQPILLTTSQDMPANAPDCIIAIEGAPLSPDEISTLSRAMIVFDGHDEAAVQTARAQWKTITAAGIEARYWAQTDGRWEQKAQHPKPG